MSLFSEGRFILLYAGLLAAFYLAPGGWRESVLTLSGLVFYAWYAPQWLLLVLALILVAYLATREKSAWAAAAAMAAVLIFFKWHAAALTARGGAAESGRHLIPLGLSFLIFELIHVVIEVRRGTIARQPSLLSLAAFALFVPCRIAGPIKRYVKFAASCAAARWSLERFYRSVIRIVIGLFKKTVLADFLALTVQELLSVSTPAQAWKVLLAYAWFLYWDFSAYSDVAIGLSMALGIEVPENFNRPYLSRNIREFWSRWHMSLSSWLGDYVFLPASRWSMRAPLKWAVRPAAAAAYLVTFAVCGAWHGLSMNFIGWGLYHGVLLVGLLFFIEAWRNSRPGWASAAWAQQLGRGLSVGLTFLAVTFGWALFMTEPARIGVFCRLLVGLRT